MQKVFAFLQITRTNNLIIMLVTLAVSYYCLTDYLTPEDLLQPRFLLLCACVVLTAAAGYIINDYHDINIDLINKPNKVVIGKIISRRWAMLLHFIFNGFAIISGFYLSVYIGLLVAACIVLLWLYSVHFKKQFLSGNLLVGTLSAFVIAILPLFNQQISSYLVWVYALFAFGINLIREIIKDAEDVRGDSKFNCKTLPIVFGVRKTKKVIIILVLIYTILLFAHTFIANSLIPFRHSYGQVFYTFYMLLFVIVPLIITTFLLINADVKSDFSRLSVLYKVIIISGLLSMVIIKL
jgi:4-hydroxybenzoate polyprenyltransferase